MFSKAIHIARRLHDDERAVAIVTSLGALAAISAFSLALTFAVTANVQQSNRDRSVKRALAVGEAGVNEATHRLNMLQPTSDAPCVVESGGQLVRAAAPGPGEWCEPQTVEMGNGATVTYQISPYVTDGGSVTRSIVATGNVGGKARRVEVTSSASTGSPLFEPFGITSSEWININGNNNNATAAVRSNDDINLNGNNNTICGTPPTPATPGPGNQVHLNGNGSSVCGPTTPAASDFTISPVDQGDARTNNDNGRFFGQDLVTGRPLSDVRYFPASRHLRLSGNDMSLTLSGHTYSLCRLTMDGNNLSLIIGATSVVRIYFDSTANCGLSPAYKQLDMDGNNLEIRNPSDPTHFQVYMMGGSPTTSNNATLSGNNATTAMTFYGPYTNLTVDGNNADFVGAIVAKRVEVNGNDNTVGYDSQVESITQSTIGAYRWQKFVECTPSNPGAAPNDGC